MFLEKHYFIEDMEIYCSNSDEDYYDKECINLFLETPKKQEIFLEWFFFCFFFFVFELGMLPSEI